MNTSGLNITQITKNALSHLYYLLCNCRKNYEEMDDLLDPKFHLDDCLYRIKVEPLNLEFTDE